MSKRILHSIVQGSGEPLVVLHGYFGMSDNWKSHGLKWSAHAEVHLIDQRNHGRSFHDEAFSYADMVADLLSYLKDKKIESAHIIGHSMGGKTAMLFATMYPEKVKSLLVVDIAPKYYSPHHQEVLKALTAVDFDQIEKRSQVDAIYQRYLSDIGTRQFLLKNIYRDKEQGWRYRFNLKVLVEQNQEIGAALPENAIFSGDRVLFISGGDSDYITEADSVLIPKHFPHAQIAKVEGAGHWVHAQKPVEFGAIVSEFYQWSK